MDTFIGPRYPLNKWRIYCRIDNAEGTDFGSVDAMEMLTHHALWVYNPLYESILLREQTISHR